MAEYEWKADSEICATCKYFSPIIGEKVRTSERENTLAGWCKKHPRLNQKHDDKTHATNWCQYYEANMDKKKLLEDAIEMITPSPDAPLTLTSEEREALLAKERMMSDGAMDAAAEDRGLGRYRHEDAEVAADGSLHDWVNDPLVAAQVVNENIRGELAQMLKALTEFGQQASAALSQAALEDNDFALHERKGALRTATMFGAQITQRMQQLTAEAEKMASEPKQPAPTFRPHRGDMQ